VRIDVGKDGHGANLQGRSRRGHKRIPWHNNFVAYANAGRRQGEFERHGAIDYRNAKGRLLVGSKLNLKITHF
jgi:hypothetical protein